jgi:hypothetical protein
MTVYSCRGEHFVRMATRNDKRQHMPIFGTTAEYMVSVVRRRPRLDGRLELAGPHRTLLPALRVPKIA